jgi:hypothetical protein
LASTHIAGLVNGASHDDHLLHTKEGLWVFGRCQCKVGKGTNGNQGHGIRLIFTQYPKDLLVGRKLGRNE